MGDGKVTIDVDLNDGKALSGASKVKGLLSGLTSSGEKAGSVFKSMLGANIIGSAVTAGIGALTGQISGLVGDINASSKAWQTFQGNMENLGLPKQEIAGVKKELQSFATETIYSASDMASTYSQLAAVGIKSTKELVTGFGGLAAAAENPGQAMKTLSTQAVQMAAKPTVAWADFKLMLEQTPAGISAVAKHMGMSTAEMVTAVQDGKIATQDFFDAINAVGNNDTFRKMATEYKTVDQAIDGLTEGVSNKLLPAFEVLSKHGIKAVEGVISIVDKFDGDGFASQIDKWAQSFQGLMQGFSDLGVFNNFKATLSSIGDMFQTVFKVDPGLLNTGVVTVANLLNGLMYTIQDLTNSVADFFQGFSNSGAVRALALAFFDLSEAGLDLSEKLSGAIPWETIGNAAGQVVKFIAEIVSAIAKLSQKVDGNIFRNLLVGIPIAIAGFKTFNFLKSFNPFSFFKKNVADGVGGAGEAVKRSKSTISQVFSGLSKVIKSSGTAIKAAATGIGTGIKTALSGVGPVLRAFGAMLRTAGVANILAFGGAIGIAAVGIGAGIGIIVASFALLATQSAGISQIITTISTSLGSLASTIIGALAQAFVTIAPYLPIVAMAFAQLSPLITAAGTAIASIITAFASLSPVVVAFGMAFSMVVTAIGGAVSQIIVAATPLVAVLGSVFTTTVQIVSTAIVQIVQALAPVIPAITEMVVAVAPVLQSMVEAFTTLITNLSPIIDSLTNLVTGLGDSIRNVLDGAKGVIESFGNAVSGILDSVAGVFDSIGNAALNAGIGFDMLARGIKRLTGLNLLDMGASLAAAATGLAAISATGPGLAIAGAGMTALGTGMMMIGNSAMILQSSLAVIPTILTNLQTSLTSLPGSLSVAQSAMMTFGVAALTSLVGLVSAGAMVTGFVMQVTMLAPVLMLAGAGLAMFNAQSNAAGSAMTRLGSASAAVLTQVTGLGAGISSSMAVATAAISNASGQMLSSLRSSGQLMVTSMQATFNQIVSATRNGMNNIVSAIRNGSSQMVSAFKSAGQQLVTAAQSAINQSVSAIRSGYGAMQSAGNYIGQGLAAGMNSALGAVRAAANALVAEAERAARAKAQIHSPSRLFRDQVGIYIGQGVAEGINRSVGDVEDSFGYIESLAKDFSFKGNFDAIKQGMSNMRMRAEEIIGTATSTFNGQVTAESISNSVIKTEQINRTESNSRRSESLLSDVIDSLADLRDQVAQGQQMVLDTGALVGGTASTYDNAIGNLQNLKGRHRL
ncbi:tape measure protein [Streptococcus orisratti]|uniref:tape measure protein n=1 Tax=Streptococcus orisratti TaxID=114652 RepID=UPI003D02FADF